MSSVCMSPCQEWTLLWYFFKLIVRKTIHEAKHLYFFNVSTWGQCCNFEFSDLRSCRSTPECCQSVSFAVWMWGVCLSSESEVCACKFYKKWDLRLNEPPNTCDHLSANVYSCVFLCICECCVGVQGYGLFRPGSYSGKPAKREAERRKRALLWSRWVS